LAIDLRQIAFNRFAEQVLVEAWLEEVFADPNDVVENKEPIRLL
jgi:hypothetical protein